MRASTKYATAVQICIFLKHMPDQVLSSTTIAKSVNTNPVVIRRLIQELRNHGIIASSSGTKGGFYLAKEASAINLWDIYLATRDEEFFKRPKVNPECVVSSNLKALVYDVFGEAEEAMKSKLQQTTIADLNTHLENILGQSEAKTAIKQGR
ncbi:MAG: Rrf2 family transcriptional regulator [Fulvivirga sp.]